MTQSLHLISFLPENRVKVIKILHDTLSLSLGESVALLKVLPATLLESNTSLEPLKSQLEELNCILEVSHTSILSRFIRILNDNLQD
jgi:ribosomal protein L7/L12